MKKTRQTYANQTYARQTYAGQRKSILTVCSGCRTLEPSVNTFLCLEWKAFVGFPACGPVQDWRMQDCNMAPGRGPGWNGTFLQ